MRGTVCGRGQQPFLAVDRGRSWAFVGRLVHPPLYRRRCSCFVSSFSSSSFQRRLASVQILSGRSSIRMRRPCHCILPGTWVLQSSWSCLFWVDFPATSHVEKHTIFFSSWNTKCITHGSGRTMTKVEGQRGKGSTDKWGKMDAWSPDRQGRRPGRGFRRAVSG